MTEPDTVTGTRPCLLCGYDLQGLAKDGKCPECGAEVARSLHGNLLGYSSPDYLERLHKGVFWVQTAIIVQVGVIVLGVLSLAVARSVGGGVAHQAIGLARLAGAAVALLEIYGWWLFSAPDPAYVGSNTGSQARKIVRITLIICAGAQVLEAAAYPVFGVGSLRRSLPATTQPSPGAVASDMFAMSAVLMWVLANVAWVVWFFAAMKYVQWLAPRIPDAKALQEARRLMWLNPLMYTLGVVLCGLGPLIALILYYNLLELIRKDLKSIRASLAHEVAGP